jgi:heme-degrading monooxygenase HmoA
VIYSSGTWEVREGQEREFVRTWEANTALLPGEHPGLVFRLLRNVENPRRFVSLVGPWRSLAELEALRATPEYLEARERAQAVIESVEVSTYEVVAEVS